MIISAKVIKKPRKKRRCESCGGWIDGEQVRLYGCAERGDKPYAVYEDRHCAKQGDDAKIRAALRAI